MDEKTNLNSPSQKKKKKNLKKCQKLLWHNLWMQTRERTLDECLRVANESRTGVIRRGTYNLKYAKGFAHSQHTISAAQQQHKHQGQQQRDSVQSTNDLFCSFFVLFFFGILLFSLVCKVLQASCSQRPLIRQRTFTLWFSFFLSLSFLFPFPFPYPLPIAHRWCCGSDCGHALSFSTLWTVDTTRKQVSKRYLLRSTTWCGCRFRLCLVNRKVWKHKRGKQFWIHTAP